MTNFKNLESNFLWDLSYALVKHCDEACFVSDLKNIFEKFLNVCDFKVLLWDKHSSTLRDFVKNWIVVEKNIQNDDLKTIFYELAKSYEEGFILNGEVLSFHSDSSKLENQFQNGLNLENNLIYFPICNGKVVIGLLELHFDEVITDVKKFDFLIALGIAARQISASVSNRILNNKMERSINFYKTMKNIAKLIESQYELTYILPIIGEVVDRFISDHLIYIFMKNEDSKFQLIWPLECKDAKLQEMLSYINEEKTFTISKDGTTGVWAIKNDEDIKGAIAASSYIDKITDKDIEYLSLLAKQISITVQKADTYAKMLQYATLDALTGLNNRRQFEIRLNQEVATAKRKNKPLCCIMLDIDYFKKVNDTYGHSAGDCVLKSVAKIISSELREYDIASRYGGEEFCILLPYTTINEAGFVANRLRVAVEQADISISDDDMVGDILKVTISIGVSSYDESCDIPQVLYQHADMALYEAKRRGRNKVVIYNDAMGNSV